MACDSGHMKPDWPFVKLCEIIRACTGVLHSFDRHYLRLNSSGYEIIEEDLKAQRLPIFGGYYQTHVHT
jgi:hypothetical protein